MLALAGIALVLLLIALPFCLRGIAKGKLDKTPVVLDAVSVAKPAGVKLENLTGKTGVTHTMLRPAGIAVVEGEKLNVVVQRGVHPPRRPGAGGPGRGQPHRGIPGGKRLKGPAGTGPGGA